MKSGAVSLLLFIWLKAFDRILNQRLLNRIESLRWGGCLTILGSDGLDRKRAQLGPSVDGEG